MAFAALRVFSRRGVVSVFSVRLAAACAVATSLGGCLGYDGVITRGAIVDERKIAQVKPGTTAPQVLSALGTPSTTSTVGGDAWYYISQRAERQLAFLPQKVTDQHVVAVYFDKAKKVQRVADYGMEDGKPIDFLSRTTPTAGAEANILKGMLAKIPSF